MVNDSTLAGRENLWQWKILANPFLNKYIYLSGWCNKFPIDVLSVSSEFK